MCTFFCFRNQLVLDLFSVFTAYVIIFADSCWFYCILVWTLPLYCTISGRVSKEATQCHLHKGGRWWVEGILLYPGNHIFTSRLQYSTLIFMGFFLFDFSFVQQVASDWDVQAMPSFMFLKGGKLVDKVVGAKKEELQQTIAKHLASTTATTATVRL